MEKEKFLQRLNQLIEEGRVLTNESPTVKKYKPLEKDYNWYAKCHKWDLSCKNILRAQFGIEHHFYKNFSLFCKNTWELNLGNGVKQPIEYPKETLAKAYAVLIYVKEEFELGLVADAKHLYEADLFSNLLEQAYELAENGYTVASAVHGRLIIENFINDLCRIKEVELEEKNKLPQKLVKLRKKGVINLPLERTIQAHYDIGTFAVHGLEDFNKYNGEKIIDFLDTIRDNILTIN